MYNMYIFINDQTYYTLFRIRTSGPMNKNVSKLLPTTSTAASSYSLIVYHLQVFVDRATYQLIYL